MRDVNLIDDYHVVHLGHLKLVERLLVAYKRKNNFLSYSSQPTKYYYKIMRNIMIE